LLRQLLHEIQLSQEPKGFAEIDGSELGNVDNSSRSILRVQKVSGSVREEVDKSSESATGCVEIVITVRGQEGQHALEEAFNGRGVRDTGVTAVETVPPNRHGFDKKLMSVWMGLDQQMSVVGGFVPFE
jgi:hypothetical protein